MYVCIYILDIDPVMNDTPNIYSNGVMKAINMTILVFKHVTSKKQNH